MSEKTSSAPRPVAAPSVVDRLLAGLGPLARGGIGLALVIVASGGVQLSAVLSRSLFDRLDPFGVSGLRFAVAAVLMLALVRPRLRGRGRAEWALIALYGASIAAMNVFLYRALAHVPFGIAITLEFLGPFAVAVLGARRPRQALFGLLGLVGVVVIARPTAEIDPWGLGFGLLAAASLAAYVLVAERISARGGGFDHLALAFTVAALLTAPMAVGTLGATRLGDLPVIVLSAVLGVVLAFSADFLAVRIVGCRTVAVMLTLDPALAAVLGAVLLGEALDPLTLVGMACVAAAGGLAAMSAGEPGPRRRTWSGTRVVRRPPRLRAAGVRPVRSRPTWLRPVRHRSSRLGVVGTRGRSL